MNYLRRQDGPSQASTQRSHVRKILDGGGIDEEWECYCRDALVGGFVALARSLTEFLPAMVIRKVLREQYIYVPVIKCLIKFPWFSVQTRRIL